MGDSSKNLIQVTVYARFVINKIKIEPRGFSVLFTQSQQVVYGSNLAAYRLAYARVYLIFTPLSA